MSLLHANVQFALTRPNERVLTVQRNAAGDIEFTSYTAGAQR